MGDKVHFATTEAGNGSSGFNGFPVSSLPSPEAEVWQGNYKAVVNQYSGGPPGNENYEVTEYVQDSSDGSEKTLVGPGTNYVGPMTREEAVACIWRVKKWKITANNTANCSSYANNYQPTGVTVTASAGASGAITQYPDTYGVATREKGIPTLRASGKATLYDDDRRSAFINEHEYDAVEVGAIASAGNTFLLSRSVAQVINEQGETEFYIRLDEFHDWASADGYVALTQMMAEWSIKEDAGLSLVKPKGFLLSDSVLYDGQYYYITTWKDVSSLPFTTNIFQWGTSWDNYTDHKYTYSYLEGTLEIVLPITKRVLTCPIYGGITREFALPSIPAGGVISASAYPSTSAVIVEPEEYWPYDVTTPAGE